MADEADIASSFIDNEVSRALGKMRKNTGTRVISKTCKECDEVIPAERRQLGFSLCIECAQESERRHAQFVDY